MEYKERESLAPHTTLHIGGEAEYFVVARSVEEILEALAFARAKNLPVHILGGGSNVLVTDERIPGLTIQIALEGYERTDVDDREALVRVGAGMELDTLVARTVEEGLWGLENLSAIPGFVGATPVQNVGAYGIEVSELIASVEVIDKESGEKRLFLNADCRFGYRHSLFKDPEGKKFVVTSVTYRLLRTPLRRLSYRDLSLRFKDQDVNGITGADIRKAVTLIRKGKFPDWRELGTAGSFFKNPIINSAQFDALKERYPEMPGYTMKGSEVKVPLGWILDHICTMRGVREGNVGTYPAQSLVIVNYGSATQKEVDAFVQKITNLVKEKTNIEIEREVTSFQ